MSVRLKIEWDPETLTWLVSGPVRNGGWLRERFTHLSDAGWFVQSHEQERSA